MIPIAKLKAIAVRRPGRCLLVIGQEQGAGVTGPGMPGSSATGHAKSRPWRVPNRNSAAPIRTGHLAFAST